MPAPLSPATQVGVSPMTASAPAPGSPASTMPKFGYSNRHGSFLLDGKDGTAIYAFRGTQKFYSSELKFDRIITLNTQFGGTEVGWVFKDATDPFWLFFAQNQFSSSVPYETYSVYYSFDNAVYLPWDTDTFTTRWQLADSSGGSGGGNQPH